MGIRIFEQYGIEPNIIINVNVGTDAVDLVEDNSGIAILHKNTIAMGHPNAKIKIVDLEPAVKLTLMIFWKKNRKLSKVEKMFIKFAKEYFKDYG